LTPRQEQFLEALAEICRHQEAAHYTDVAQRLQVSKWTAYDMMQRLEAAGYVERLYEVDPSTGGRSRILFRPVAGQAPARPQGPSPTERLPSEWQALRPWLLQQVQDAQDRGGPQVLHDLHEALRGARSPGAFCAVFTTVLLVTLKLVADRLEVAWLVETFLPSTPSQASLLLFAGAALAILYRSGHALAHRVASHAPRYRETLARLDDAHHAALSLLAQDLARHLWADPAPSA